MQQAILDGAQQIAVPAFVSTLCICIVFVPMFFLTGVGEFLFVPLAEAVVFAMLACTYFRERWCRRMVMYLMRGARTQNDGHAPRRHSSGASSGLRASVRKFPRGYRSAAWNCARASRRFRLLFPGLLRALAGLATSFLGQDFFPQVDAGLFRLHVRGRAGLRVEETARLSDQIEAVMREEIPRGRTRRRSSTTSACPTAGINLSYSNCGTIGTSDAEILIALDPSIIRRQLTTMRHLREVCRRNFRASNSSSSRPISLRQILNFGLPAPIDVQLIGTNMQSNYEIAQQIANRCGIFPARLTCTCSSYCAPDAAYGYRSHSVRRSGSAQRTSHRACWFRSAAAFRRRRISG